MATELPVTIVKCDGSGEDLNLLLPHLEVFVRPVRQVLIAEEIASADPNEIGEPNIYLGTKAGRGPKKGVLKFKDFDALAAWVAKRKGKAAKLEVHREDEIYVPEDNRLPEEIAEDEKKAASLKAGER